MLEFLEEFGKFFRLSDMLSKESVKQRMNSDEGMSLNEFLYQSLQAMDFMLLSKFMDCKLQIGGSDQWGNILSGVTLVRKMTGAKVHGLTFPLLTDSRGQKFGKSSSNKQIWLNPDLTSPFDFFQFWFNLSDLDAIKLIDVFLDLSVSERKDLDLVTDQHPAKRTIQKRLAFEMTKWVHGEGLAEISRFISTSLTSERITKDQLSFAEENFDSLPNLTLKEDENPLMSTVLADSGLARSRSDAKRKIKEGCVFSNKARLAGDIHSETFMMSNPCIIQLGKKHLIILKKET
jgi:tyrosyl-tRNA synthetase